MCILLTRSPFIIELVEEGITFLAVLLYWYSDCDLRPLKTL